MAETDTTERQDDILTEEQARVVARMRLKLPLQARAQQIQEAELVYHTIPWRAARRRIAQSLPWRAFRFRRVVVWEVEDYPHLIPDAVLLKLAEAENSGLFESLWVAEPTYERHQLIRTDPWLIGLRHRDRPPFFGYTPVSVIAYWK